MAETELEKAKAIALSSAADNEQIGADIDFMCSNKPRLAVQSVSLLEILSPNATVDYACFNEPQQTVKVSTLSENFN